MANHPLPAERVLFQCKGCERHLDASEFYVSNTSRCKGCVKERARENRNSKIDYYRSYDRKRYREQPQRQEFSRQSAQSDAGLRAQLAYKERLRRLNPEKLSARNALNNAIRDGRIARGEACFFCGSENRLHGHHPDYSRPLDVFWLCNPCHGKLHTVNGDFLRREA